MPLVLTGEGINFTVATVEDFPTTHLEDNLVCIVTEEGRGGTFIYKSYNSAINNGGTIFNGWTRQYNGAVNVKWFGAKGDWNGISGTDDTSSFNNAISILSNNILDVSNGVYLISGLTATSKDKFKITGNGTLFLKSNSNIPTLKLTNCTNFTIENIIIDGNSNNQTIVSERNLGAGLSISGQSTDNFKVDNITIKNNFSGAGLLIVMSDYTVNKNGIVSNNKILNCGKVGGTLLSDGVFSACSGITFFNNTINTTTDYGMAFDYSRNIKVISNNIYNVPFGGLGVLGNYDCNFEGNTINGAGIGIAVTLSGNSAIDPFISYNTLIANNNIKNITRAVSGTPNGDAIFIDPSAIGVQIISNKIDTAYRGIGSSSKVICMGNDIKNTTDRGLFASGTGSVIVGNILTSTAGLYYGTYFDKVISQKSSSITYISSFIGGWSNFGGTTENAGYFFENGYIQLVGCVKGGTASAGQPIFQLPTGSRPDKDLFFVVGSTTGTTTFNIDTAGNVSYNAGISTKVSLDQIRFKLA